MRYSNEDLTYIADKTNDHCHLCNGKFIYSHYGRLDKATGWEVDHSKARSKGGSEKLSNKLPAHVRCNRSKGTRSTRDYRRIYGFTKKPKSKVQVQNDKVLDDVVGAIGVGIAVVGTIMLLSALFKPRYQSVYYPTNY